MTKVTIDKSRLSIKELSLDTWKDFKRFHEGKEGTIEWKGCYCTYWEFMGSNEEWNKLTETRNPAIIEFKESLVREGKTHGFLLYLENKPIAWMQYGHRSYFAKLNRYDRYQETAGDDVTSITCFGVVKEYRKQGIARALLRMALEEFKRKGIKTVEGYPRKIASEQVESDDEVWQGPLSLFLSCGFEIYIDHERYPVIRKLL
ncbi:hypothetical protein CEE36_01260 [candidate division TA06 bacterium B3_TA06]|uniref:N-acetyltransferase domain-containing protein n=1 Tax=candidate division TA06 bacterium B3_TA06 TaxID=2012487 RepID=A0A532VB31_UNCT6|nr:MAG: hypothetical protein CEE36_01260 [candidate division TA06 bacterium B3_TA06]